MKNIHLIPTDKPSRLYYNNNDLELQFCELCKETTPLKENRNIYITSDEEIKEGDWCLDIKRNIIFQSKRSEIGTSKKIPIIICTYEGCYIQKDCKKIILTTDQDLINLGVQAIDDEFLEWFVKNPSCEEVEVIKTFEDYTIVGGKSDEIYYKIIIPKEEQKQHLIDMIKADEELGLYEEETKCYCGHTTYCDCGPEQHVDFINSNIDEFDKALKLYKQETLEEAAEFKSHHSEGDFIRGGRWQQERSYSKEEVLELLVKMNEWPTTFNGEEEVEDWFEQFKKK